jgi:hypothetical protein
MKKIKKNNYRIHGPSEITGAYNNLCASHETYSAVEFELVKRKIGTHLQRSPQTHFFKKIPKTPFVIQLYNRTFAARLSDLKCLIKYTSSGYTELQNYFGK